MFLMFLLENLYLSNYVLMDSKRADTSPCMSSADYWLLEKCVAKPSM